MRLTLDTGLQHLAEKHLEATVKRFRAKGGTVLMADPFTGAILAAGQLSVLRPQPVPFPGPQAVADPRRHRHL